MTLDRPLPLKLRKEPLLEAVFEFRFEANSPVADIAPGFLYGRLEGPKTLQRLPNAELPRPIRLSNNDLKYAPIVRLDLDRFTLLIGDQMIGIACKLPYPGWTTGFRAKVLEIIGLVSEINSISEVARYSIKFVNLIPSEDVRQQIELLDISIDLGESRARPQSLQLRLETMEEDFIHLLSITAGANAEFEDGRVVSGIVLDVDTIVNTQGMSFADWLDSLPERVDALRHENKSMFFGLLKPSTVDMMEPEYA